ncbi:hypothetical protein [Micromonospora chersina]
MFSRVRSGMGCELSVREVFDATSLRDIAAQLGAAESRARLVLRRRGTS